MLFMSIKVEIQCYVIWETYTVLAPGYASPNIDNFDFELVIYASSNPNHRFMQTMGLRLSP